MEYEKLRRLGHECTKRFGVTKIRQLLNDNFGQGVMPRNMTPGDQQILYYMLIDLMEGCGGRTKPPIRLRPNPPRPRYLLMLR